jgi:hypothetical protein
VSRDTLQLPNSGGELSTEYPVSLAYICTLTVRLACEWIERSGDLVGGFVSGMYQYSTFLLNSFWWRTEVRANYQLTSAGLRPVDGGGH